MSYYKNAIGYAVRHFIESLTNRYIEWLEDNEQESDADETRQIMQGFNAWLYKEMKG